MTSASEGEFIAFSFPIVELGSRSGLGGAIAPGRPRARNRGQASEYSVVVRAVCGYPCMSISGIKAQLTAPPFSAPARVPFRLRSSPGTVVRWFAYGFKGNEK
jgi:hypothetical protein